MANLSQHKTAATLDGSKPTSAHYNVAKRTSSLDNFLYGSRLASFSDAGTPALAGIAVEKCGAEIAYVDKGHWLENTCCMHKVGGA